jgi:hypothetical protein
MTIIIPSGWNYAVTPKKSGDVNIFNDKFQDIDKQRLLELYYNDVPIEIMADELGISYYKCREFIRVLGLPKRKNTYIKLNVTTDEGEIKKMIDQGMTNAEVAEELGISIDIAESIVELVELSIDKDEQDGNDGNEKRVHWC